MKVIVKYNVRDYNTVSYAFYRTNGDPIRNMMVEDEFIQMGGIASTESWMKQDVHRSTEEILKQHPGADSVEYEFLATSYEVNYVIPRYEFSGENGMVPSVNGHWISIQDFRDYIKEITDELLQYREMYGEN